MERNFRWSDSPCLSIFRIGGDIVFGIFPLLLLELLVDEESLVLKIDLPPAKPQAFALPQAGKQTEGIGVAHWVLGNGIQKSGNLRILQRSNLFLVRLWKLRRIAGISLDITLLDRHLQRLVEDRGGVFHGFGRKIAINHFIVHLLDINALEALQLGGADGWLDVVFDGGLVCAVCQRLHGRGAKRLHPHIKPCPHCELCRGLICAVVEGALYAGHLLPHGLLGVAVDASPDGLARAGVIANDQAAFPASVRALADGAGAGGGAGVSLLLHPLSPDDIYPHMYHIYSS